VIVGTGAAGELKFNESPRPALAPPQAAATKATLTTPANHNIRLLTRRIVLSFPRDRSCASWVLQGSLACGIASSLKFVERSNPSGEWDR
jgi:hypothetical protein